MDSCDAIIVGGGPAGSTCAWQLRLAGLDVVVLDRARFPRDKPCAGWITPAVVEELALPLDEYADGRVLQRITGFRTGLIGGTPLETRYPDVVSYGIRRREFDAFLLERSGARVREGHALSRLERAGGCWIVNDTLRAPLLIGAGGHFCPVARHLREAGSEPVVVAREVEFEMTDPASCRIHPERPELYFASDLKGYGWCFRKQDVLNVGLGRQDPHGLSRHVHAFLEWLRAEGILHGSLPAAWKGHAYLLAGTSSRPVAGDGWLLVGDAAGLAYPASGEGIRPAVESALLAARTIVETGAPWTQEALEPYRQQLHARFRGGGPGHAGALGHRLVERIGAWVLGNRWLTRHLFLPRVFLQPGAPLSAGGIMPPHRGYSATT